MAATPKAYEEWQKQPSIIVDPSLYVFEPSHQGPPRRVLGGFGTKVRATLAGVVISVAVFAITLAGRWLSHGAQHETPAVLASLLPPSRTAAARDVASPVLPTSHALAASDARFSLLAKPATLTNAGVPTNANELVGDRHQIAQAKLADASEQLNLDELLRAGRKQLAQAHPEQAEESFRRILTDRPNHPGALSGLARAALARGDLEVALGFARNAVRAAPAHATYHAVLGEVLSALGEVAAADLEYETASRLSGGKIDRARAILPPNPYESDQTRLAQGSTVPAP